jgi:hypothetical protein
LVDLQLDFLPHLLFIIIVLELLQVSTDVKFGKLFGIEQPFTDLNFDTVKFFEAFKVADQFLSVFLICRTDWVVLKLKEG